MRDTTTKNWLTTHIKRVKNKARVVRKKDRIFDKDVFDYIIHINRLREDPQSIKMDEKILKKYERTKEEKDKRKEKEQLYKKTSFYYKYGQEE